MSIEQVLRSRLQDLGLGLGPEVQERLLRFITLLSKWNRVYNLTSVRDPKRMVTVHILDSLSVLDHLRGPRILDVGTGPGFPGIPLALARPAWEFVLVDSNGKKTRFVQQAVTELEIRNVSVVRTRVEDFHPDLGFDSVVSRAFRSISDMLRCCQLNISSDTEVLAMKGLYPEAELTHLPEGFSVREVVVLNTPGIDGERHLVRIGRVP